MKIKLSTKDNDALRSIVKKYRNPFFTIDWLADLLNPSHCPLCEMYFINNRGCLSDCPIFKHTGNKCSCSYYYKKILKYRRLIMKRLCNDYDGFSFKDRATDRDKLKYWLNKTADKMEKILKESK